MLLSFFWRFSLSSYHIRFASFGLDFLVEDVQILIEEEILLEDVCF